MPLDDLTGGLFDDASLSTGVSALLSEQAIAQVALIRAAVVSELQANAPAGSASRIRASRFIPYEQGVELPAIGVYTLNHQVKGIDESPRAYLIEIEVALDIATEISGTLDGEDSQQETDAIAHVVHAVLDSNRTLDELTSGMPREYGRGLVFERSETSVENDGQRLIPHNRLIYKAGIRVEAKDIVEDDLDRVDVDWDLGPAPDGQLEAEDEIEIDQTPIEE